MDKPVEQLAPSTAVIDKLSHAASNGEALHLSVQETATLSSLVLATVDAVKILRRALDSQRNEAINAETTTQPPPTPPPPVTVIPAIPAGVASAPDKETSQPHNLRYDVEWVLMDMAEKTVIGTERSHYITCDFSSEKEALDSVLRREAEIRCKPPRLHRYNIRTLRNGKVVACRSAKEAQKAQEDQVCEAKKSDDKVDNNVWYEIEYFSLKSNLWVPQIMAEMPTVEKGREELAKLTGPFRLVRCSRQVSGGVARSVVEGTNQALFGVLYYCHGATTTLYVTGSKEWADLYARDKAEKETNSYAAYLLVFFDDDARTTTVSTYKAPYFEIERLSSPGGLWVKQAGRDCTSEAAVARAGRLAGVDKHTVYRVVSHDIFGTCKVLRCFYPVWYEVEADPAAAAMSAFHPDRPGLRSLETAITVWQTDRTRCDEMLDAVVCAWGLCKGFRCSRFNILQCGYDDNGNEQRQAIAVFVGKHAAPAHGRNNTALKDASHVISVHDHVRCVGYTVTQAAYDLMSRIVIAEPSEEEEEKATKKPLPAATQVEQKTEKFSSKVNRLRRVVMACVEIDDSQFVDAMWNQLMDSVDKSRSARMELEEKTLQWLCEWFHVVVSAAIRRIENRLKILVTDKTTLGSIFEIMERRRDS